MMKSSPTVAFSLFLAAGTACSCSTEGPPLESSSDARSVADDGARSDAFINAEGHAEYCPLAIPNASISGTTPCGEITHSYAWGQEANIWCFRWKLLTSDRAAVERDGTQILNPLALKIFIDDSNSDFEKGERVFHTFFEIGRPGYETECGANAAGTVTLRLDSEPEDGIVGSILVQDESGWDLSGEFEISSLSSLCTYFGICLI